MIRERGSNVAPLVHDFRDPICEKADGRYLDEDACCPICSMRLVHEQAATAINFREVGLGS